MPRRFFPSKERLECSGEWNQKNSSFVPHFNAIPLIRRGILASVSSVYDPLGMVAPFLVTGKQIPQELFKKQTDWDEPVLVSFRARWEK